LAEEPIVSCLARLLLCAFFTFGITSLVNGQTYTITALGVLRGDSSSASNQINSSGQVVGCSDTSTQNDPCSGGYSSHAFLWNSKKGMKDLGTLHGDSTSSAFGVNDPGEVVGYSQNEQNVAHAFLWRSKGGMVALPKLPGGTTNFAVAINAAGVIVGASDFQNSNGNQDAVMWTADGKIHDLGTVEGAQYSQGNGINSRGRVSGQCSNTSGAFVWTKKMGIRTLEGLVSGGSTVSFGINNIGTVVGNAQATDGTHPVLWTANGKIRDLGTLAGGFGTAFGSNDLNQIVGYSTTASDDSHAFLWTSKKGIQDLNDLIPTNSGWVLVWGSAINNAGQITGWGTINGENHAYLLTP
jgi:probable HAF family extracellular repeat protein